MFVSRTSTHSTQPSFMLHTLQSWGDLKTTKFCVWSCQQLLKLVIFTSNNITTHPNILTAGLTGHFLTALAQGSARKPQCEHQTGSTFSPQPQQDSHTTPHSTDYSTKCKPPRLIGHKAGRARPGLAVACGAYDTGNLRWQGSVLIPPRRAETSFPR